VFQVKGVLAVSLACSGDGQFRFQMESALIALKDSVFEPDGMMDTSKNDPSSVSREQLGTHLLAVGMHEEHGAVCKISSCPLPCPS
jgi:hypothetical protein